MKRSKRRSGGKEEGNLKFYWKIKKKDKQDQQGDKQIEINKRKSKEKL